MTTLWARIAQSVLRLATGRTAWGVKSSWGLDFPHLSRHALGPNQSPVKWVRGLFTGGIAAAVWRLTTHPHLAPTLKKDYSYTCAPLGLQGLLEGEFYISVIFVTVQILPLLRKASDLSTQIGLQKGSSKIQAKIPYRIIHMNSLYLK
jgi:hypothetical protein